MLYISLESVRVVSRGLKLSHLRIYVAPTQRGCRLFQMHTATFIPTPATSFRFKALTQALVYVAVVMDWKAKVVNLLGFCGSSYGKI